MFLALCREGEFAWTPSGRKVVILGSNGKAAMVQDVVTAEEFEIMPRFLRHAPGGAEGARVGASQHPLAWTVGRSGQ